jgi:NADH-quinone oxidoreductase subunit C
MEAMNEKVLERIQTKFPDIKLDADEFRGELTIVIPKEKVLEICRFLKEDSDLCFDFLADL